MKLIEREREKSTRNFFTRIFREGGYIYYLVIFFNNILLERRLLTYNLQKEGAL